MWVLNIQCMVSESAFSMTSMALCRLSLQNYLENYCMGAVIVAFVSKSRLVRNKYNLVVCTTQVNSTFHAHWLTSLEEISQVLFTSELPKKNKMVFVGILSQIKLLFGPLVIQLVWYIPRQLFTSVSVKVVDIYLAASRLGEYPPLLISTSVNNC